ncbi:hypothetical protein KDH_21060 [Dictyobacter sp. S3.2.2.5]|uniref:HTH luxR-type domain-containing protein n=1 Tax=Dictyobacter halimunensis TaxID=3026934 RepID=A0ABQ6FQG3_9CHLR|nr:hypothetical protein KDH_21060 [Dictyobacter sp. S3.2.2.5]
MTRNFIPVVVDEYLWLADQTDKTSPAIIVGSHDWYAWLADDQHTSFAFKQSSGNFTARHERQRNGWYWYAYRKRGGRIHKIYLGRPAEMSLQRLEHAACVLAARVEPPNRDAPQAIQVCTARGQRPQVVLAEKFAFPTMAGNPVERPRLFTFLTSGARGKLTLISAPAGWGKTILLSSWCASHHAPHWPHGWITLDSHDNDIQSFWSNILAALDLLHTGIAAQSRTLLVHPEDETIHMVIKTLLNACQQLTMDTIIIIDNYQAIQAAEIHRSLSFFLDHLPARLHVIISSRTMPPLPLARLRVQGALTEIRQHQLRFTEDEAGAFFRRTQGITLDDSECAALTVRTEGWIAGLQLALLSISDKQHVDTYLNHNRYIRDYLIEEVIQQQTTEVQQFMLRTSIVTRLNAGLCDTLRQAGDSQLLLEQLERANLCQPLTDQHGSWYSYAPLLRETLLYLLQRTDAQQVQQLHQRASQWYEQQAPRQSITLSEHVGPKSGAMLEPLTRREQQVLRQLLNGASNRDIARSLIISEGTVKKHVFNICSKLGVQSRSQAMARSIALSLL